MRGRERPGEGRAAAAGCAGRTARGTGRAALVRARDPDALGRACALAVLAALRAGDTPRPEALRAATRYLLDLLAAEAPGRAVEVRVPPYAAVQCIGGPRHTRERRPTWWRWTR